MPVFLQPARLQPEAVAFPGERQSCRAAFLRAAAAQLAQPLLSRRRIGSPGDARLPKLFQDQRSLGSGPLLTSQARMMPQILLAEGKTFATLFCQGGSLLA